MYVGFFSRSMNLTMKWRRKSTDSWMCFRSTWGSRTADPTPWRRRLTTTLTPVRQLNTYMATVFSIYQICFHSLISLFLNSLILAVYSEVGGDEELPLGPEFQDHLRCFVDTSKKDPVDRYRMSEKLIRQLEYVNGCLSFKWIISFIIIMIFFQFTWRDKYEFFWVN